MTAPTPTGEPGRYRVIPLSRGNEETMKSYLQTSAIFALACVVSLAFGQEKITPDKLPPKVAAAVKARFPGAAITSITKEVEDGAVVFDIEMMRDGKKHEMDCKEDGTLVDIQNQIAEKDLPPAATTAIKAKYPGSKITEVGEILVVKGNQERRDHFEVLIETADKKEVELTVSLDGSKIE
jgi:hypothetical protein